MSQSKNNFYLLIGAIILILIGVYCFYKGNDRANTYKINYKKEIEVLKGQYDSILEIKYNFQKQRIQDSLIIDSIENINMNLKIKINKQINKSNEKINYINNLSTDSIVQLFNSKF